MNSQYLHYFLLTQILLFGWLQVPAQTRFFQGSFPPKEIGKLSQTLADSSLDIQGNLEEGTLILDSLAYTMVYRRGKNFLVDESKQIHAVVYRKQFEVQGQRYKVKGNQLVLLSDSSLMVGQAFVSRKNRTYYVGISSSTDLPDLVVGIFFYKLLLRLQPQDPYLMNMAFPHTY
ncbi:MAG: hypothetical protein AAF587_37875 [Bacteroidota bacterium]